MSEVTWQAGSAKCLLTGEHSVLIGTPALCLPVSLYTISEFKVQDPKDFCPEFTIEGSGTVKFKVEGTYKQLQQKVIGVEHRYRKFLNQEIPIEEVLNEPTLLVQCALMKVLDSWKEFHTKSFHKSVYLKVRSSIPLGSGFGSSAALISSVLKHAHSTEKQRQEEALKLESYQHGYSSGLDTQVSLSKKIVLYSEKKFKTLARTLSFEKNFTLIHTGKPKSSTGQCVQHSQQRFAQDPSLKDRFFHVTKKIVRQIEVGDFEFLSNSLFQNQLLLHELGVVPDKVQHFLKELSSYGLGGKISGAGSLQGESAGLLLVQAQAEDRRIQELVDKFGYQIMNLKSSLKSLKLQGQSNALFC